MLITRVEAGGAEGEEQSIHQRHLLPVLAADGQQLLAPVAAQQAQAAVARAWLRYLPFPQPMSSTSAFAGSASR